MAYLSLFLNTDLIGGFADFATPAASAGLFSGSGLFVYLLLFFCFFLCVLENPVLLQLYCWNIQRVVGREAWPYGACYLLCIIRTDTHQLLLWMTRRQGQMKKFGGGGGRSGRGRDNKSDQFNENFKMQQLWSLNVLDIDQLPLLFFCFFFGLFF